MADREIRLDLEVTSDADKAAREVDGLTDAYQDLAKEVKKTGDVAKKAESKIDGITESADGLASTSGQATGALGALSSGFDLVGLGAYSEALGSASMATDFLSGVGDSLNLILGNQKVAAFAASAATKAQTVATNAQAVAQRALNLVTAANPIALIVIAVVALVAGLVLLYKRSEKFREIVADVGEVGRDAIDGIVDVTESLVGFVKDDVPDAFRSAKDLVVGYIRLITTPYRKVYELIQDSAALVRDKVPGAFNAAKNVVVPAVEAILAPFKALADIIQDVLDLIGKIKIPDIDLPNIPGLGRSTPETEAGERSAARGVATDAAQRALPSGSGSTFLGALGGFSVSPTVINVNVTGALDQFAVAQQILEILTRYLRQIGAGPLVIQ